MNLTIIASSSSPWYHLWQEAERAKEDDGEAEKRARDQRLGSSAFGRTLGRLLVDKAIANAGVSESALSEQVRCLSIALTRLDST
jgi:hypothetical protein